MMKGDFSSLLGSAVGTDPIGRPIFKGAIYDPKSNAHGQRSTRSHSVSRQHHSRFPVRSLPLRRSWPCTRLQIRRSRSVHIRRTISPSPRPVFRMTDQGDTRVDFRAQRQGQSVWQLELFESEQTQYAVLPGRPRWDAFQCGYGRGPGPKRASRLTRGYGATRSSRRHAWGSAGW